MGLHRGWARGRRRRFGTVAARTLIDDPPDTARRLGQSRMEIAAALEGLLLPFLATAGLLSLLAAFY